MRNSKVKGFTLIELIVVIAIIGILAAILVPSMLGYVRNARISQANANAKQVHTAVSSSLTQLGIGNFGWGTVADATKCTVSFGDASGGAIACTWTGCTGPSTDQMDLVSYLGENFKGNAKAYFNSSTYSTYCAIWTTATTANAISALGCSDDATGVASVTETKQKSAAKNGTIVGVFPQPKLS